MTPRQLNIIILIKLFKKYLLQAIGNPNVSKRLFRHKMLKRELQVIVLMLLFETLIFQTIGGPTVHRHSFGIKQ